MLIHDVVLGAITTLIAQLSSNLSAQQYAQLQWFETQRLALIETVKLLDTICSLDSSVVLITFVCEWLHIDSSIDGVSLGSRSVWSSP